MPAPPSFYERVGGDAFFDTLTQRFYAAVADDPVLRPLYPEDEAGFEAARTHLRDFLIQLWGGPSTYSAQRGHPRLRQRHLPFAIGQTERDAWVDQMSAAVREAKLKPLEEQQLLSYFAAAATHLINQEA